MVSVPDFGNGVQGSIPVDDMSDQIYIYLRHLMVSSEISLLVAILSIARDLQQYRAILSIALHCVTEVVYCG